MLNEEGKVIAISFLTIKAAEVSSSKISSNDLKPFNFAIPSKYLQALLDRQVPEKSLDRERSISAYTYYIWGYTKFKQGRYAAALTDFNAAIRLDPQIMQQPITIEVS